MGMKKRVKPSVVWTETWTVIQERAQELAQKTRRDVNIVDPDGRILAIVSPHVSTSYSFRRTV
jgi:hypothetical protein